MGQSCERFVFTFQRRHINQKPLNWFYSKSGKISFIELRKLDSSYKIYFMTNLTTFHGKSKYREVHYLFYYLYLMKVIKK